VIVRYRAKDMLEFPQVNGSEITLVMILCLGVWLLCCTAVMHCSGRERLMRVYSKPAGALMGFCCVITVLARYLLPPKVFSVFALAVIIVYIVGVHMNSRARDAYEATRKRG